MENMTIGSTARQAGVGVETIRFYERRGLIQQPGKPPGTGRRRYTPETVERIRFIRQAQHLGFVLREIQELLSLQANPAADCSDVRGRALVKIEEVSKRIAQLAEIRSALVRLLAACPGSGALGACSILEALRVPVSANTENPTRSAKRAGKRGAVKTVILSVDGMHYEGCAKTIEALLTKMKGSPVVVVPSLAKVPKDILAHVFVFKNGVAGEGPFKFRPDVFDGAPGAKGYSPLRELNLVTWKDERKAREFRHADEVRKAAASGEITIDKPGVVVNMPLLTWPGGQR